MNDLHAWLSQQHHGLRTFRIFQQKLETLGRDDPEQRGLCRLLSGLVGSYVETFDEAPLPVEIADGAYHRLLTLVASLDLDGDTRPAARRHQPGGDLRTLAVTRACGPTARIRVPETLRQQRAACFPARASLNGSTSPSQSLYRAATYVDAASSFDGQETRDGNGS